MLGEFTGTPAAFKGMKGNPWGIFRVLKGIPGAIEGNSREIRACCGELYEHSAPRSKQDEKVGDDITEMRTWKPRQENAQAKPLWNQTGFLFKGPDP